MANSFTAYPVDGGSNDVWGPLTVNQWMLNLGVISSQIYMTSNTLYIDKGFIGFDDGTKGIVAIASLTALSCSGNSSEWAVAEMLVTGTAVTFTMSNSGSTTASNVPTTMTDNWQGEKAGYYRTTTSRIIACTYNASGGTATGCVVPKSNLEGYNGFNISDDADEYPYRWNYDYYSPSNYEYYEYGENANGIWERWDHSGEKLQRCWDTVELGYQAANYMDVSVTFAKAFANTTYKVLCGPITDLTDISVGESAQLSILRHSAKTTTTTQFELLSGDSSLDGTETCDIDYEVIGEWS